MKKIAAVIIAATLTVTGIACDQTGTEPTTQAQALTDTVQEIGQDMLARLDDMREGDNQTDQLMALSDRLTAEVQQLDGDEGQTAMYIAQRVGLAFNALADGDPEAIPMFEAARDELAVKVGEPTRYDQDQSLRELAEAYIGQTFGDDELID